MLTNEVVTKLIADNKQFDSAMKSSIRVVESFKQSGEKVTKTVTEFAQTTDGSVRALKQFNAAGKEVGQTMTVIAKQAKSTKGATAGFGMDITDMGKVIKGFVKSDLLAGFGALGGGLAVVGAATEVYFDNVEQGAKKLTLQRFFEQSGKDIQSYRESVKGMVSDSKLMAKANLADTMGINQQTFMQLARVAQAATAKTGQSFEHMFDSIITGTARESRLILDNLGIIVSVEEANKRYAASINKVVSELTDEEKKIAFLNEVGRQSVGMVSELDNVNTNLITSISRTGAAWDNLIDGFQKGLAIDLEQQTGLHAFFDGLTERISGAFNALGDALGRFGLLDSIGMGLGNLITSPLALIDILRGKSPDDFFSSALDKSTTSQVNKETNQKMVVNDLANELVKNLGPSWREVIGKVMAGHADTVNSLDGNTRLLADSFIDLNNQLKVFNIKVPDLIGTSPDKSGVTKEQQKAFDEANKRNKAAIEKAAKERKDQRKNLIDKLQAEADEFAKHLAEKEALMRANFDAEKVLLEKYNALMKGPDISDSELTDFDDTADQERKRAKDLNGVMASVQDEMYAGMNDVQKLWFAFSGKYKGETEKLQDMQIEILKTWTSHLSTLGNTLLDGFKALTSIVQGTLSNIFSGGDFLGKALSDLTTMLVGTITSIGAGLNQLSQMIGSAFGPYGAAIGAIVGTILAGASAVAAAGVGAAGGAASEAASLFEQNSGSAEETKTQDGIETVTKPAVYGMLQVVESIQDGVSYVMKTLTELIGEEAFKNAITTLKSAFAGAANALRALPPETINALRESFQTMIDTLATFITNKQNLEMLVGAIKLALDAVTFITNMVGVIKKIMAAWILASIVPLTAAIDVIIVAMNALGWVMMNLNLGFLKLLLGINDMLSKVGLGFLGAGQRRTLNRDANDLWREINNPDFLAGTMTGAVAQLIQDLWEGGEQAGMGDPSDIPNNTAAVAENTEAIRDLAREFRNMPSGYKVARAMYGAEAIRSNTTSSIYDANDNDVAYAKTSKNSVPRNTQQYRF